MTTTASSEEISFRIDVAVRCINLSRRALAERLGVSHSFVSAVATGKSLPSVQMLVGLRAEFGVSLDWLLLGAGAMFAEEALAGSGRRMPHTGSEHLDNLLIRALQGGETVTAKLEGFLEGVLASEQPEHRRRAQAS